MSSMCASDRLRIDRLQRGDECSGEPRVHHGAFRRVLARRNDDLRSGVEFPDLRHAIERGEFVLHYQPKVELASGALTGFEALIQFLQAYIFTLLTAVYISGALHSEH